MIAAFVRYTVIARARLIERGMLEFRVATDWGVRTLQDRPVLGMEKLIPEVSSNVKRQRSSLTLLGYKDID